MSPHKRAIILVGMMGSGKTTIGRILAGRLGFEFRDSDAMVEAVAGKPILELFGELGEESFREMESAAIQKAIASGDEIVLATGGGAVLDPENIAALRRAGNVFWLHAETGTLIDRVGDGARRPLWSPLSLEAIAAKRERLYARVADAIISTDHRTEEDVAGEIAELWKGCAVSRTVTVQNGVHSYPVLYGHSILDRMATVVPPGVITGRVLVVSNDMIAPLYLERVLRGFSSSDIRVSSFILPEGEENKSLLWLERLYDWGVHEGADRHTVVAALGGGVIGDIAGLFAATFMRGLPLVHMPTTLVAQVDSSIGGKVAVNHPAGKNLIGTFHHPCIVAADIDSLDSLPPRDRIAGLAEVIKHAAIMDEKYFTWLEEKLESLLNKEKLPTLETVTWSGRIKAGVVHRDPEDRGFRAVLNFGHTIGHAIESAYGYGRYRHGEAVAAGMAAAALISQRMGLLPEASRMRLIELLGRAGLPVTLPPESHTALIPALRRDKKAKDGRLGWVLLDDVGQAVIRDDVPDNIVLEALEELSSPD